MSHFKGDRQQVLLRLAPPVVEELRSYKVQHGLDGLGEVAAELLALRRDRDEELEAARREAREALERLQAALALAGEQERQAKHYRKRFLQRQARKEAARFQRPLPGPEVCSCGAPIQDLPRDLSQGCCAPCRRERVKALTAGVSA